MSTSPRKASLLASLGAGLEYYDFAIYGMMVVYLNTLFFTSDASWMNEMKAFAVFAVGYFARPFGGILFGMLGDTIGRKASFLSVMILMAVSTFAIGLLPTYGQVGVFSSVLLIFFRFLQGLSFGAELPGAITVVNEYVPSKKSGFYSSLVVASTSYGALLASFVLYLLSKSTGYEGILTWGWRIPFLLGGLLALVSFYLRKRLSETPEFAAFRQKIPSRSFKEPLYLLLGTQKMHMLLGIGLTFFVSGLIIFALYLPTYLSVYFGFIPSDIYLAMTGGLLWSALSLPLFGLLADCYGHLKLYFVTSLVFLGLVKPLFVLLELHHFGALLLFMALYQTAVSCSMASYFPILSSLFSTATRYTGIAFCYNVVYAFMGSVPFWITWLIEQTSSAVAAVYLLGCALIAALSTLCLLTRGVNR